VPHGMYVLYRTVWENYSKINFEIRFLLDGQSRRFDIRAPIFGMNPIPEGLQRHIALFRIESKQIVHSWRPVCPLSTPHIPGPTACTA